MKFATRMTIASALAGAMLMTTASMAFAKEEGKEFVEKAAIANKFEIDSSKLALTKSGDPEVKKMAQMIIDDHTKAGEALGKAITESQTGIIAPSALDKKHEKMLQKLEDKKNGKDFDNEYTDMQHKAHKDAIDLFEDYAKDGDNAALKNFASTTLPTLKAHNTMAEKLDAKY